MSWINYYGYLREYVEGREFFTHIKVWLDHYDKDKVPDGYVIHHINGDRLDNRIQNLQCVEKEIHIRHHFKKWYKNLSNKEREKYCSDLIKNHNKWLDEMTENERKEYSLKISKGMKKWWNSLSDSERKEYKLKQSKNQKNYFNTLSEYEKETWRINKSKIVNTTGYFRVFKAKCNTCNQGFRYVYQYYEDGKHKHLSSVDINKLQSKVENHGLPWIKY